MNQIYEKKGLFRKYMLFSCIFHQTKHTKLEFNDPSEDTVKISIIISFQKKLQVSKLLLFIDTNKSKYFYNHIEGSEWTIISLLLNAGLVSINTRVLKGSIAPKVVYPSN